MDRCEGRGRALTIGILSHTQNTPWAKLSTERAFVAVLAASAKVQALGQPEGQRAVVSDARERHMYCCGQELAFGLLKLL